MLWPTLFRKTGSILFQKHRLQTLRQENANNHRIIPCKSPGFPPRAISRESEPFPCKRGKYGGNSASLPLAQTITIQGSLAAARSLWSIFVPRSLLKLPRHRKGMGMDRRWLIAIVLLCVSPGVILGDDQGKALGPESSRLVGRLVLSSSGDSNTPPYCVVDHWGRVVGEVSPAAGIDLRAYCNRTVTLVGTMVATRERRPAAPRGHARCSAPIWGSICP